MKIDILFVRHCESCSNVIAHSKSIKKKILKLKQGGIVPPNCTMMGILQSFIFGFFILPLLLKKFPKFKKINFYSSVLKRAMITCKFITYGLQESNYKIDSSKRIERLCHVSEKLNIVEKYTHLQLTGNVSIKRSNKQISSINKRYKRTGKKVSKKINKRTKKCSKSNYDSFIKDILPTLDPKSLNLIVSHGKYMKKYLKLSTVNNLDACLVEYDTSTNKFKVIIKINNVSKSSNDQLSHKTIQFDPIDFHYKGKGFNHKTQITYSQYKEYMSSLSDFLDFDKKNNEITCNK